MIHRQQQIRLSLSLTVLALIAVPAVASAQSITEFDVKGGGTGFQQGTIGYALDDSGDITGVVLDSGSVGHGFVRTAKGKITVFDAPGGGTGFHQGTAGKAIDSAGDIAGFVTDASGVNHGFIRDGSKKGTITVFDVTGAGTADGQGTTGTAIDDAGDVVGSYLDSRTVSHGFIRNSGKKGKTTTFDIKGSGTALGQGTEAQAINASGLIVGQELDSGSVSHAFICTNVKNGKATVFDVKGAGTSNNQGTFANSINTDGAVAGQYIDAKGTHHAFLRDSTGKITKFDAPGAGSGKGQGTVAYSINDAGVIAGAFFDSGTDGHGFVRAANGTITVFDASGAGTGIGQGTDAFAINTGGTIAGYLNDSGSVLHGYIRTP